MQGRDREGNRLYLFSQIKEITGVEDEHLIQKAITACQDDKGKYKVDDVVAMLLGEEFHTITSKKKAVVSNVLKLLLKTLSSGKSSL